MDPILIVIGFVIGDLLVAWFLIWGVMRIGWRPMMNQYPPRDPAPNAVGRNFQSFRFGVINLGFSVHVAADEEHLHLRPAHFLRWCGAGPISVPWSAIRPGKPMLGGKWMTASINGKNVAVPAWCLELANPKSPTAAADQAQAEEPAAHGAPPSRPSEARDEF